MRVISTSARQLSLCRVLISLLLFIGGCSPALSQKTGQTPTWPLVAIPQGVQTFKVMPQAEINGVTAKTQGFFSPQSPDELTAWYTQAARGRWVKNKLGPKTILGQWAAPFFTTVQIESSGSGSKVIVATTLQSQKMPERAEVTNDVERLMQSLPGDTRLLEHLVTADPGQVSNYYVLDAPAGLASSLRGITTWLGAKGYRLTIQSPANQSNQMLQFAGNRSEAVVVIGKRPDNATYIVINDIRFTP